MNFVAGKIGLTIRFNWKNTDTGWFSAADDLARLVVNLAYNNPNDNFYLIGPNDVNDMPLATRTRLFPNNNVISAYDKKRGFESCIEYFNKYNINIDAGVLAYGSMLLRSIPGKNLLESGQVAKVLERSKTYIAPYTFTLNELNVKWIGICDDPRHLMVSSYDLLNQPIKLLSQINDTVTFKHYLKYMSNEMTETTHNVEYANVEITSVLDEDIELVDDTWKDRKTKIGMALNCASNDETLKGKSSNGCRPRYPILKNWFLDHFDDVSIYGKWPDEIMNSSRSFKGAVKRDTLYQEMFDTKHSLAIPIKEDWATSKYLELLKCGVSPFLHPEYDTQKNTKLDDFYRVQNEEEFIEKLNMSDNEHIDYIRKNQQACLSEDDVSGQKLNDRLYNELGIERDIKNKKRNLWKTSKKASLDFFT
tara:strand:- start:2197 stop:3456 length:1260 start_codon:yes stop_codon:yes gene_type:complete